MVTRYPQWNNSKQMKNKSHIGTFLPKIDLKVELRAMVC